MAQPARQSTRSTAAQLARLVPVFDAIVHDAELGPRSVRDVEAIEARVDAFCVAARAAVRGPVEPGRARMLIRETEKGAWF